MRTFLLILSLSTALGAVAATSQHTASLGLSQNLGRQNIVMALNNVTPESTPNRSALPMAALPNLPSTEATAPEGAGFELESGLLLALAGLMALLIISRRRMPR